MAFILPAQYFPTENSNQFCISVGTRRRKIICRINILAFIFIQFEIQLHLLIGNRIQEQENDLQTKSTSTRLVFIRIKFTTIRPANDLFSHDFVTHSFRSSMNFRSWSLTISSPAGLILRVDRVFLFGKIALRKRKK